jgi:hypothetical protein
MSAIASFYLLNHEESANFVNAAKAQDIALKKKRWGIFPPKLPLNPDPLWTFVKTRTQQLEEYPYSGYLLLDVELMIPDVLASNHILGIELSKIVQSTFISFSENEAVQAISILQNSNVTKNSIKDFLLGEEREDDFPEIVPPILHSIEILKLWLSKVKGKQIGVLSIG